MSGEGQEEQGMDYWRQREQEYDYEIERLKWERDEARAQKDGAYAERDQLVAAVSALYPSHLQRHPESDVDWEDDWRWIVVVELPTGQATWHIHDSELNWFDHLARDRETPWDGHDNDEKYRRLEAARKGEG